jgi:hypothetical protein
MSALCKERTFAYVENLQHVFLLNLFSLYLSEQLFVGKTETFVYRFKHH